MLIFIFSSIYGPTCPSFEKEKQRVLKFFEFCSTTCTCLTHMLGSRVNYRGIWTSGPNPSLGHTPTPGRGPPPTLFPSSSTPALVMLFRCTCLLKHSGPLLCTYFLQLQTNLSVIQPVQTFKVYLGPLKIHFGIF